MELALGEAVIAPGVLCDLSGATSGALRAELAAHGRFKCRSFRPSTMPHGLIGVATLLAVIAERLNRTQSGMCRALLNTEEQKTRTHALPILRPNSSTRESVA
jgi:hypothetical protein